MDKPVHVVFVNRFAWPDESATAQLLTDLGTALASEGLAVEVVTSRLRYTGESEPLPAEEKHGGVRLRRVWTTRFGRSNLLLRACDYLTFYLTSFFCVLRHVHKGTVLVAKTDPPLLGVPLGLVARMKGAHLVSWCQDLFPEIVWPKKEPLPGKLLRALRNRSLRRGAAAVVLGEDMRSRLSGEGIPSGKLVLLPNWADGEAIRPQPTRSNPLRAEWGLADAFVVGYSGNLGRVHDYRTLLEAACALPEDDPTRFLFFGGGALRERLEAGIPAAASHRFVFRPYQPREALGTSLAAADVHWLSLAPDYDGLVLPSKLYGILAAGRPALYIGHPQSEIAGLLEHYEAGLAVAPGDSAGLVEAMNHLRLDTARREQMGCNARALFEAHFTFPAVARQWTGLLKGLTTPKR